MVLSAGPGVQREQVHELAILVDERPLARQVTIRMLKPKEVGREANVRVATLLEITVVKKPVGWLAQFVCYYWRVFAANRTSKRHEK